MEKYITYKYKIKKDFSYYKKWEILNLTKQEMKDHKKLWFDLIKI
jgi:hypothetical protein